MLMPLAVLEILRDHFVLSIFLREII